MDIESVLSTLTTREREVLLLRLQKGLKSTLLAKELGISPKTVKVHMSSIRAKICPLLFDTSQRGHVDCFTLLAFQLGVNLGKSEKAGRKKR